MGKSCLSFSIPALRATLFDKSLEPLLGKRVGTSTISLFGVRHRVNIYRAPVLYLGRTPLMMTETNICTYDINSQSTNTARPIMGILGMNVLSHYCLQLDFKANEVRFLDDEQANKSSWGKDFPLVNAGDGCFFIMHNLTGTTFPGSLIDTGCSSDGWMTPDLYCTMDQ